jgi:hypothetical protein
MEKIALLSSAYLPPAIYFQKIISFDKIFFEDSEHFVKQTYRNRCTIYGANGKLDLIIPLVHSAERTPINQKKISYSSEWQKLHWRSLQSAYRSSPYFEFFESDFEKFYIEKYEFLFEFNIGLTELICKLLKIPFKYEKTGEWKKIHNNVNDFRSEISPKAESFKSAEFPSVSYYQVFADKYGFIPNLSIVDLIFNEGLNSMNFLKM